MYFTLYLVVSIIAIIIGFNVYILQRRSISGLFFMLFTVFMSTWFMNYFLFFTNYFSSVESLLYSSRINFLIGLITAYNLLFFVIYFNSKKSIKFLKRIYLLLVIALSVVFIFTGFIVESLRLDQQDSAYREVYGGAYLIVIVLYAIFAVGFVYMSYHNAIVQKGLDQIRLKKIVQAGYLLFLFLAIFQIILPIFGIWILEREIIFFYLAFVARTYFVLRRYYFRGSSYNAGRILNMLISLFVAVILTNAVQKYYIEPGVHENSMNYWVSGDYHGIILITSGIVFFHLSYELLKRIVIKKIFGLSEDNILKDFTSNLQKNISRLTTFESTQSYIQKELKNILGTTFCRITNYNNEQYSLELKRYFESDNMHPVFINDMVFIEENSKFFDKKLILGEIPKDTALIFPLYDESKRNSGLLILGQKPLNDFYTMEEIQSLHQIILFIESHLKYLKTYEQIQDFSRTLDKKVDEKTIEYNDLINKQKEFISTISHEIKSPIAGAVLQADSIMEDMSDKKISREVLKEEVSLLSTQLMKVGDLLSKLFSVQYFDTHTVTLFKERVQMRNMINMELDIYEKIHEHVRFTRKIDQTIGFIKIDKIQFQQVITNLITNAVKFSHRENPEILVEASIQGEYFYFSVEDNGVGFSGIDIENIFEKYAVGSSESIGLGIGLYLCKRIVEMHDGKISARIGPNLHGARVDISIPA